MPEVTVPPDEAGGRLDRFLASLEDVGSRAAAERLIEAGAVTVDGTPRAKSHRLAGGEQVAFPAPEEPRSALEPQQLDLAIPYRDEHLLVVDKPAGLIVHPVPGYDGPTLVHGLIGEIEGEGPRPGIVHRLDRDTSGLLILARSEEAHRRLAELVRARAVERTYLALAAGRPRSRRGRIEAAIGRDRHDPTRVSLDTDTPRDAVTEFEVERLWPDAALLRVRLETGRMHQIRVHLAAIELPVAGDPVYGVRTPGLDRQFLHASELGFDHPFDGRRIEARSELPNDLAAYLAALQ